MVELIKELYTGACCHIRTADGISEDFQVKTGVRQGCVLSPLLFNCVMDRILREVGMTNWQEIAKDRDTLRAVVRQPKPAAV